MHIGRYRVEHGDRHALRRIKTDDRGPFTDKASAAAAMDEGHGKLDVLQKQLYASDRYALLLIFQGMDAAGKDSAITHVLSGVSPQGTDVHAFKQPSTEELAHDFLWRAVKVLPARGGIGIFNRSYYEDVTVVRVRRNLVGARKLPADRLGPRLWRDRLDDISAFERHLDRNATIVCKFFLHVSRAKQRQRLLERLDDPAKRWKFEMGDLADRELWPRYQRAYAEAIAATSHGHAPWYVVPADHKWFAQLLVTEIIIRTLSSLDLKFPALTARQQRDLAMARKVLRD